MQSVGDGSAEQLKSSVMAEFEAEIETEMRAAFEELDDDSSGSLELEEVSDLVQKLEPELYPTPKKAAAAAAKLFKECDLDNSGDLDYEEFSVYWKREGHKKSKGRWGEANKAAAAGKKSKQVSVKKLSHTEVSTRTRISWVGVRRLFHLCVFPAASRMV